MGEVRGGGIPLIENYKMSTSCFLEGIDPVLNTKFPFHVLKDIRLIFKLFKNLLDGSSGCANPRLPVFSRILESQVFDISKNTLYQKGFGFFPVSFEVSCLPDQV